jgi:hypothetical protein
MVYWCGFRPSVFYLLAQPARASSATLVKASLYFIKAVHLKSKRRHQAPTSQYSHSELWPVVNTLASSIKPTANNRQR